MPALAAQLATTYLANDTAIVPVLQAAVLQRGVPHATRAPRCKRPLEDLVSSCRTMGITPDPGKGTDGLQALWWESDSLGHMPLAWPMPNGYSDVAVDWQSTNQTLERWNLHMALAGQWWPVGNVDPSNPASTPMLQAPALSTLLPSPLPTTYGAFVDAMAQRLVYQKMAPAARAAVLRVPGEDADLDAEVDGRGASAGSCRTSWRWSSTRSTTRCAERRPCDAADRRRRPRRATARTGDRAGAAASAGARSCAGPRSWPAPSG